MKSSKNGDHCQASGNTEIKIINEILIFLLEDICEVVIDNFEPKRD